ncbi:TetR/AcrR family transcriptional regulator [Streptomyces sp. col6]|uniref:TetR/AcrR family transcriptional regulator n=1 Tax=Streptomyces sp. col6 TaxID=2478958 RepID=UPI0011CE7155|nr:TetR/AcrR family transcriptional regulator [Streptomyces sp. col6]TXS01816.1 TetR/AcrR family transcriptional regulator [Streptomyces sp. col6]
MVRMSAQERREVVVRAAVVEFARGGYHGTSTETIARRSGVSQPYVFRLFPGKQALFLAAATRCLAQITGRLVCAAEGLSGEDARRAMANAYTRVIVKEPENLLMQMQVYAAAAAADAEGDHAFAEAVREPWQELWDAVHLKTGADIAGTTTFVARGMLVNTLVSLGFPAGHRVWNGLDPSAGIRALEGFADGARTGEAGSGAHGDGPAGGDAAGPS